MPRRVTPDLTCRRLSIATVDLQGWELTARSASNNASAFEELADPYYQHGLVACRTATLCNNRLDWQNLRWTCNSGSGKLPEVARRANAGCRNTGDWSVPARALDERPATRPKG